MQNIRPAAVANMFYPGDAHALAQQVQTFLTDGKPRDITPKALIVPHAGYIYSGAIAAAAYATLRPIASHIRRVILLGPAHRVAAHGLVLPDADAFDTPLGRVMIDSNAASTIARLPQVSTSSEAHEQEHSLEVQLPRCWNPYGAVRKH